MQNIARDCEERWRREIFAGGKLAGWMFLLGEETAQETRFVRMRHD